MIKSIINKIWKTEGQEDIETPQNLKATFVLKYDGHIIGYLTLENGSWKFKYSEEFQKNPIVIPIMDFPDLTIEYHNQNLWPFFSYRIPGLNQPAVKDIIKKDHIDDKSEVELLKKFGKYSIFNPYRLEYAA